MPELSLIARRIGDYESRTEEYELEYALDNNPSHELRVRYQAARAYEINARAIQTSEEMLANANNLKR